MSSPNVTTTYPSANTTIDGVSGNSARERRRVGEVSRRTAKKPPALAKNLSKARLREDVHRDDELRPDLAQHLDHLLLVQRIGAVDRHHHDIDRAEFGKMRLCQRVVQVAQMRDAQIGHLENKDRVAVVAGAAELADIGRHIADANISVFDVMVGEAPRGVPAAEHVLTPGSTASL